MDKQQKLKIALPILFVVMAFVWGPVIMGAGSKEKDRSSRSNAKSKSYNKGNKMNFVELPKASTKRRARTSFKEWGRNPFVPGYDSKALFVEGIVWDKQNPKAVINGAIRGVGDSFGSNSIIAINPNSVIIRTDEGEVEVTLGEGKEL